MKRFYLIAACIVALLFSPAPVALAGSTAYDMVISAGIPQIGAGSLDYMTTGNVYFVDSGSSYRADSADHGAYDKPFATIDYAVGRCTASNGDIIFVAPGHTETVTGASGIDVDVAGIRIIGLGEGDNRPVVTFTTSTAATVTIDADDIYIENLVFSSNKDQQVRMVKVTGDDVTFERCEFRNAGSSVQPLNMLEIGTADNDSDNLVIDNCTFRLPDSGDGDAAISIEKAETNVQLTNSVIWGDFDEAAFDIVAAGSGSKNLQIHNNKIANLQTGQHAIQIIGTVTTGIASNNKFQTDTQTSTFDASGLSCHDNTWLDSDGSNDEEAVSVNTPILSVGGVGSIGSSTDTTTDTLHGKLGTDSELNDNSFYDLLGGADLKSSDLASVVFGSDGITTFPIGVAAANDVSLAEVLRYTQENIANGGTNMPSGDSVFSILAGTSGITTYPAAAAAANGVSIAEVVRDIWDGIRNGSGGSEPGTDKSVIDAIGFDGLAVKTVTAGSLYGASGQAFIVEKVLTSSGIVTTGIDVTGTASGGDVYIEDIIMETDGTGLANGTNFTLEKDAGSGVLTFFGEAVANLGANKTEVLSTGSVTPSNGTVLESGQKIVAKCTVLDCTGAGTITLYIKARRVAAGATVAATP